VIDLGLAGRGALVTGAGAGIGRAIAAWLARAGCDVAIVDRDRDALAGARGELADAGHHVVALEADLRADGAAASAVAEASTAVGGLRVAVNNVGGLAGLRPAPFTDQDDAYLGTVVAQNLLLTAACCRAEAAAMIGAGSDGVILNVSSGESTRPALGLAAYGAAKAAINHLTQTLAVELGPAGIRVNAVAPGTTLTPSVADALTDDYVAALVPSIPLGRMNEPDDLARLVVALASDLGRGVTGQLVLSDNGAHLARNRPRLETT
jgi:NAD(P)-dependent dehydrogenase (short-subunit alcohol dehydrogenase family)